MVINLSGQKLDDGVSSLLQKGLNYAVTPRPLTIQDILAGVAKAVQSLPVEMEEEARQETLRIIKSSSRLSKYLTRAEREALRTLKKNTDLSILPADKGNATMILNTVDYKQKITSLREDPSYRRLARDPPDLTEQKTTLPLKKSTFTEDICKQLCAASFTPSDCMDFQRYIKRGFLRYALSAKLVLLPTNSKYLAGLLSQLTGNLAHHVKNSFQFIQITESPCVQPESLMVSFNMVSLFTNVPIVDSLELLSLHFEDDVLALFKHVLTSPYFCFDGRFYEQTDGVAMGSPLSPVIANFFMDNFEKKAIE